MISVQDGRRAMTTTSQSAPAAAAGHHPAWCAPRSLTVLATSQAAGRLHSTAPTVHDIQ